MPLKFKLWLHISVKSYDDYTRWTVRTIARIQSVDELLTLYSQFEHASWEEDIVDEMFTPAV